MITEIYYDKNNNKYEPSPESRNLMRLRDYLQINVVLDRLLKPSREAEYRERFRQSFRDFFDEQDRKLLEMGAIKVKLLNQGSDKR